MDSEYEYAHEHSTEADRERCETCNPPTRVLGVNKQSVNDQPAVITGQVPVSGNDPDGG